MTALKRASHSAQPISLHCMKKKPMEAPTGLSD
jgi:hypothetical protein